jgi:hypothetical protein
VDKSASGICFDLQGANLNAMKILRSFFAIVATVALFTASAFADGPTAKNTNTAQLVLPVFKTVFDSGITYYRTRINGEDVLVDNKGRLVKYLCSEEDLQIPEGYKLLTVPANLFRK